VSHEIKGLFRERVCERAFDCRSCPTHQKVVESGAAGCDAGLRAESTSVAGLDVPLDRFYHRGHTWVRPEDDGTVTIGLDAFATQFRRS